MEDVQNRPDERQIPIDHVGVCDLRYPIVVLDRENESQETVATLALSVNLPHYFKGTHMSRFIEILDAHCGEITMRTIPSSLGLNSTTRSGQHPITTAPPPAVRPHP